MTPQPHRPSGVRFGAAYYLEYQPTDDPTRDLDLMQAAHFTVIRVGESTWSTWEPSNGESTSTGSSPSSTGPTSVASA